MPSRPSTPNTVVRGGPDDAKMAARDAMRQERASAEAARQAAFVPRNPAQGLTAAQRLAQQAAADAQKAQGIADTQQYRTGMREAFEAAKGLMPNEKTDPAAYEAARANMDNWRATQKAPIGTMRDAIRADQPVTAPTVEAYDPSRTYAPREDFKKGGKVVSASKRADGIAQRGKTKGRMV